MGKKFPDAERNGIVKEVTSSSESDSMTEIAGGPEATLELGSVITGITGIELGFEEATGAVGTFICDRIDGNCNKKNILKLQIFLPNIL